MSGDTLIWLDGVHTSALPLPDRGLEFGDGLFETLLVRAAQPLFAKLHLQRLQRGCQALAFPSCEVAVRDQLDRAAADLGARGWQWAALRITLTRGAGQRGYAPPENPTPRIIISATKLVDFPGAMATPAIVGLAEMRWPTQPALCGLKHLNRLEQVMAARESRQAGFDEAVMLDQQGRVVSVIAGNLFYVLDAHLLTAPLDDCGIAGTRRDLIMRRWAPALGLAVREESVTTSRLEQADEVFYSNSLVGIRPIGRFGQRSWNDHSICEALYQQYRSEWA